MTLMALLEGLSKTKKKSKDKVEELGSREAADKMEKEAKKNDMILSSNGIICSSVDGRVFAAAYSRRGGKGINQDSFVVWKNFGFQDDTIFCGVFDGHGPWGHIVSKNIRKSIPGFLLSNWKQGLGLGSAEDSKLASQVTRFDVWKQSCLKSYAAVDQELKVHPGIDAFCSGSTALTIIKQGDALVVANVGDTRTVLATTTDDGGIMATQLTVDFKPNLPQEAERISKSRGRVFSTADEPGVYRIWTPKGNSYTPGLAISRALGDHCLKDFGLISVPEVTNLTITKLDQFLIVATDGIWDVLSNEEAVQIVSSTPIKDQAARRLVHCAAKMWNEKRRNLAMDDMSAICLFFH